MTDWDGWPEDLPGFDSADGADLPEEYGDEAGLGVEGFGTVDEGFGVADVAEDLAGPDDETAVEVPASLSPIGYDGLDAHVDEPLDATFDDGQAFDLQDGFGTADPPVGTDPDLDPRADAWPEPTFPDPVDVGPVPEPVDGFPWTDPAALGDAELPAADTGFGAPDPAELAEYAGEQPAGQDPWAALAASGDPATSTLARWWSSPGVV